MRPNPDVVVLDWLNSYDIEYLWLTSITIMEIKYGIEILADGKKKKKLQDAFSEMLRKRFKTRIIEFDDAAAIATAELAAESKKAGFNKTIPDLQIAGIALATGADLATRNSKGFQNMGISLINPWKL